jgi:hypothetical protein
MCLSRSVLRSKSFVAFALAAFVALNATRANADQLLSPELTVISVTSTYSYALPNVPADQNGYSINGDVLTNTNSTTLTASNIIGWSYTISSSNGTYGTYSDYGPAAGVTLSPTVVATPTSLVFSNNGYIELASGGGDQLWVQPDPRWSFSYDSGADFLWNSPVFPSNGGFSAVPEPTSMVAGSGLGVMGLVVLWRRRKQRR